MRMGPRDIKTGMHFASRIWSMRTLKTTIILCAKQKEETAVLKRKDG